MEQFKLLDKNGKRRLVVFLVLMALSVLAVQTAAGELAEVLEYLRIIGFVSQIDEALHLDNPFLTGLLSTYSDIGNVSAVLLGGVLTFLLALSHVLVLVLFRVLAFRAETTTTDTEYLLAQKLQKGICIVSAAIAVIKIAVSSFLWGIFGIVFSVPMVLFSWLFYLLPLKERLVPDAIPEPDADTAAQE